MTPGDNEEVGVPVPIARDAEEAPNAEKPTEDESGKGKGDFAAAEAALKDENECHSQGTEDDADRAMGICHDDKADHRFDDDPENQHATGVLKSVNPVPNDEK
jgi:hypothetical protein